MCIKMVVFFTFWQQTFFTILFWLPAGKQLEWCDPCCPQRKPTFHGNGSAAEYNEYNKIHRCDSGATWKHTWCGFCPDGAEYDNDGNVISGADYHVLENNTMQATLVSVVACYQHKSYLSQLLAFY